MIEASSLDEAIASITGMVEPMKSIIIEIDATHLLDESNSTERLNTEELTPLIIKNEMAFHERMWSMIALEDLRANLMDDSLQVEDISLSGNSGVATVSYEYSAYYGCKDVDYSDDITDEWEFIIDGSRIIFKLDLPINEREDEI